LQTLVAVIGEAPVSDKAKGAEAAAAQAQAIVLPVAQAKPWSP
jgi:GTP-binding protein